MLERVRNRVWGPADRVIATLVCLVLLGAGVFWGMRLVSTDGCGEDLQSGGSDAQCIGVTGRAHAFDPEINELVRDVAEENNRVRSEWENPQNGRSRIPYVRIALMMPYTSDASSAMSMDLIKHSLAGAHTAQLNANRQKIGLQFELLMANIGKDLDHWKPVVDQLSQLTGGDAPLVGVIGLQNSEQRTKDAAEALSERRIPAVSAVLSSPDMKAEYLFKLSPSNRHFIDALNSYLEDEPGSGVGYLVWDSRREEEDNYVTNLRTSFEDAYGEKYGLRNRNGSFLGIKGDEAGTPQRFSAIAEGICQTKADTVFYAGRDLDLPALIQQLSVEPTCEEHPETIRIVRTSTGLDPVLTASDVQEAMEEAGVMTVSAAATDPRGWQEGHYPSQEFPGFTEQFEERGLPATALDDGYAIMHYDAFTVLVKAADRSLSAPENGQDGQSTGRPSQSAQPSQPSKDDIYNTITNMKLVRAEDGRRCVDCVRGASGTFGFDGRPTSHKWPICKPVPIVEFPEPPGGKSRQPYLTYQEADGTCP